MRKWLLSLGMLTVACSATAQPVYNPTRMTCAAVQTAIARNGVVILSYTSRRVLSLPVYNRYVDNIWQCGSRLLRQTTVPTLDDATCSVRTCDIRMPRSRGSR
ncbi:hypothetical protein MRS76_05885 [Rhizobiaceae bacterium n13]|uniref:Uncharacterized protein n=1 Tax=Ferirhizobium litorale TaxID=2927786 RepID=A0AAE3QAW0_9HYPH|nr:hypothetical protein [Fererhizobium litorale]MDI7861479.1 hypothetical protein [Fererhizobium litorale]MDI7921625.1 hypothetical protein [Fererhizobium litorale]